MDDIELAAIRLLTRREHSRLELVQKLKLRGFSHDAIERVIEKLIRQDYLNNQRFIEVFIRSRRDKGMGPLKIEAELRTKGITPAEMAGCALFDNAKWCQIARQVRFKKFGRSVSLNRSDESQQRRFLQQRGFTPEHIRAAFESITDEIE